MKNKILIIALSFTLIGPSTFAQTNFEVGPGRILPNSPVSFLDSFGEWLRLNLTFNSVKKAELKLKYASERLGELRALEETGKLTQKLAEKLREKYEKLSEKALKDASDLKMRGQDVSGLVQKLEDLTARHVSVLEDVLSKVPEQARDAVTRALEVSRRGHDQAIEVISKEVEEGKIKTEELKTELRESAEIKGLLQKLEKKEEVEEEEIEEIVLPAEEELEIPELDEEEINAATKELEMEELGDLDKDLKTLEAP